MAFAIKPPCSVTKISMKNITYNLIRMQELRADFLKPLSQSR